MTKKPASEKNTRHTRTRTPVLSEVSSSFKSSFNPWRHREAHNRPHRVSRGRVTERFDPNRKTSIYDTPSKESARKELIGSTAAVLL